MRTGRTNGTTTYNYVYNGGSLSQMTAGTNTLRFAYDASGAPMAVNFNGTNYYYLVNLQGDVMGIVDSTGNIVVNYTYDAWGKPLSVSGMMASTLGTLNPLRYRGYVYDQETGLYYLQSRYYNPEIGRFINADSFTSTGQGFVGNNMFAYCGNNPVNRIDSSGEWWCIVTAIVATITTLSVVYPINNWVHKKYNQSLTVDGYIYNQQQGVAAQYKYGFFRSSHNGCGWIATYNATIMLGKRIDPTSIIREFEFTGAVLFGAAGTWPYAISSFFRKRGYRVTITYDVNKFDQIAKRIRRILFGMDIRPEPIMWHFNGLKMDLLDTTHIRIAQVRITGKVPSPHNYRRKAGQDLC